jgi:mannose-6-phosphate isomerase-like protein (cupin superfamily)
MSESRAMPMNENGAGVGRPLADWSESLKAEFEANTMNGCVGQTLVSESDRVRVWSLRLRPGERIGFHRHVLDYFWTVLTDGQARSSFGDGSTRETSYRAGDTRHLTYGPGQFLIHDLENTGETELVFTTVEFLESANDALEVPLSVRRQETKKTEALSTR